MNWRNKTLMQPHRAHQRAASVMVEAVIALILLSVALNLGTQLIVRGQRLLDSARDYRLALDELENLHDELASVSDADLTARLAGLAATPALQRHLPHANMSGEIETTSAGQRLTLRVGWGPADVPAQVAALSFWRADTSGLESGDGEE